MHPGALLDLATELLRAVLAFEAPADGVVSAFFRRHPRLGARERHTLAETAYHVLRRRRLWQHLAQSGAGPLERRLAMLAWQGDAIFLRGALAPPEQAWLERARAVEIESLAPELRHNLPDWLAQALQAQLGDDQFWALAASLQEPAPLVLRVNTLKAKREAVRAELAQAGVASEATLYSPWGLRVEGKPAVNQLDAFKRGDFEVQDEGSQLLALLVDAKRAEMVVDFCAGAGGKTLALGAAMRNSGRLYAFDVSGHRLDALKPRLARSGLSNVHPVQIAHERDARIKRLAGKIDRVLVDAPCSGLGTLRRNPDLKWRHSPQSVRELVAKQGAILAAAARLLKPGGRLVYATCSLLAEENESLAAAFEATTPGFDRTPVAGLLAAARLSDGETLVAGADLRLRPQRHGCDGFYAAVWERRWAVSSTSLELTPIDGIF